MGSRRIGLLGVGVAILSLGCSSARTSQAAGPSEPPAPATATPSAGPTDAPTKSVCRPPSSLAPETETFRTLPVDGIERRYRLGLPEAYDSAVPTPLALAFHGAGDSGSIFATISGIEAAGWARGYIMVHPDAVDGVWDLAGGSDLDFVMELLEALNSEFCLDAARQYVVGNSQGGDFATYLACYQPDRFAALAMVSVVNARERCPDWRPIPAMAIVGRADPIYRLDTGLVSDVPFSGDEVERPGPMVREAAALAAANGCEPEANESIDLGTVTTSTYDCPPGAALVLILHDGGHGWPSARFEPPSQLGPDTRTVDANAVVFDFFGAYVGS